MFDKPYSRPSPPPEFADSEALRVTGRNLWLSMLQFLALADEITSQSSRGDAALNSAGDDGADVIRLLNETAALVGRMDESKAVEGLNGRYTASPEGVVSRAAAPSKE